MTDSIDTSEREAEEPAFINLPVREMSDEPAPQQPADALRTALQLALEATPEQLPAALDALRDQLGLTTSSPPCAMRYDFDGHGWQYIDAGSGSDWMTRVPGAEPVYDGASAPGVPDGWQRVPKEPTAEMLDAAGLGQYGVNTGSLKWAWRDMLASAPPAPQAAPIDMVLHCPACGMQHVDAPEWEDDPHDIEQGQIMSWRNEPHRSHLCHGCGHVWRPADVPTNGVQAVKTKGKADSPPRASQASVVQQESPQASVCNKCGLGPLPDGFGCAWCDKQATVVQQEPFAYYQPECHQNIMEAKWRDREASRSDNSAMIAFAKACTEPLYTHPAPQTTRCELCQYQHGHQIGCANNPVDIALKAQAQQWPFPGWEVQHPIDPEVSAELERSDWTPEEALRWYAAGRHYDTVPNGDGTRSARILDTGAVASNALKSLSREYAESKGDVALLERAAVAQQEPVMIYHGDCVLDCGEHGHHNVELLKMIPAGSLLYTHPAQQEAAQPVDHFPGTGKKIEVQDEPNTDLMSFYGVDSVADLVKAQAKHIEKLQSKLPQVGQPAFIRSREG